MFCDVVVVQKVVQSQARSFRVELPRGFQYPARVLPKHVTPPFRRRRVVRRRVVDSSLYLYISTYILIHIYERCQNYLSRANHSPIDLCHP